MDVGLGQPARPAVEPAAEVRGEVVETVRGPEARDHIDSLSMKYHGHEYRNRIQSERLLLRIKPLRQQVRKA